MGLFGHFLPFHECFKLLPFNVSALLYEVIPSPCDCEPFGVETFFLLIQLLFGFFKLCFFFLKQFHFEVFCFGWRFFISPFWFCVFPSCCFGNALFWRFFCFLVGNRHLFGLGWLLLPFCVGGFRLKVRLRRYCDWLWLGVLGWSFSDFLFFLSERSYHFSLFFYCPGGFLCRFFLTDFFFHCFCGFEPAICPPEFSSKAFIVEHFLDPFCYVVPLRADVLFVVCCLHFP